ncbi:MAG: hypothetical protein AAB229_09275 [Candidatus Hydrogenedentota bacterium]
MTTGETMERRRMGIGFPTGWSALISCLALLSLASCADSKHVKAPAQPVTVHSLVFLTEEDSQRKLHEEYVGLPSSTDLQIRYSEYQPIERRQGNLISKALSRIAKIAGRSTDGTVEGIVDQYDERLDKLERGYKKVEALAEDIGIDREDFRQGLGITTAAAMTTLGTLHALKPRAQTEEMFGTKIRAGYDITRLDDPRMTLSYDNRMRVLLSREGICGSLGTARGLTYSGELNVRRMMATANLSFQNAISLGAVYAHKAEEVKGYVRVEF